MSGPARCRPRRSGATTTPTSRVPGVPSAGPSRARSAGARRTWPTRPSPVAGQVEPALAGSASRALEPGHVAVPRDRIAARRTGPGSAGRWPTPTGSARRRVRPGAGRGARRAAGWPPGPRPGRRPAHGPGGPWARAAASSRSARVAATTWSTAGSAGPARLRSPTLGPAPPSRPGRAPRPPAPGWRPRPPAPTAPPGRTAPRPCPPAALTARSTVASAAATSATPSSRITSSPASPSPAASRSNQAAHRRCRAAARDQRHPARTESGRRWRRTPAVGRVARNSRRNRA